MPLKLKTVIVDDDPNSIALLKEYCGNSSFVDVVAAFNSPKEFLKAGRKLKYDLCILDIIMPELDGTAVARELRNKAIIFVTGNYEKLRAALELAPIDIVTKPVYKGRLDKALGKAFVLVAQKTDYKTFNAAGRDNKVKLCLPDILLVTTDEDNSRHKMVYMRGGKKHILMACPMEDLLEACPLLVQLSKGVAVSLEMVNEIEHNTVTLKGIPQKDAPKQLQVGRPFRKKLMKKLSYF
jgi:DNA-binding LytR/AlgR family response regulator